MRKAAMVIPWVREIMEVGEELTAKQIIGRIKAHNAPLTGQRPDAKLREKAFSKPQEPPDCQFSFLYAWCFR